MKNTKSYELQPWCVVTGTCILCRRAYNYPWLELQEACGFGKSEFFGVSFEGRRRDRREKDVRGERKSCHCFEIEFMEKEVVHVV